MSLKQKIVIVNEFTNRNNSSRGSTPGKYVTDYISRPDAVDILYPLQSKTTMLKNLDDSIKRYKVRDQMKRESIRNYDGSEDLQESIRNYDGADGLAFGNDGLSYSKEELAQTGEEIQRCFDEGHTVLKTVVSFQTDYLIEQGILPPDFEIYRAGDFRNNVDQLKLRSAVNTAMKDMTDKSGFDVPLWIGTIQVDSRHVHAHFALTDKGNNGRIRHDGEERGKLSEKELDVLRIGIHRSLTTSKHLKPLHSQTSNTQRNVMGHTQDLMYDHIRTNILLQQIMASLPKNKRLWKYRSDDKAMIRPNNLMQLYVRSLQENYDSLDKYKDARSELEQYASEKANEEFLSEYDRQQIVNKGLELLNEKIADNIYSGLRKRISNDQLDTKTGMIVAQSYDSTDLKQLIKSNDTNAMTLFAYRSQAYAERMEHNMDEVEYYIEATNHFEINEKRGEVTPDAYCMYELYQKELQYHMQVVDKYRTFVALDDRFDSRFHVSDALREKVERDGNELEKTLEQYQSYDDTSFIPKVARQLLDDKQVNVDVVVDKLNNRTARDVLLALEEDMLTPLPTKMLLHLDEVGRANPIYRNVGRIISDAQITELERKTGSESFPNTVIKQIEDYADVRNDCLMREWGMGYLNANEVENKKDLANHIKSTGEIPDLPVRKPKNHLIEENSAYVKDIRALDLHDILDDFPTTASRRVGNKHIKKYEDTINERLETADAAVEYLERTRQSHDVIFTLQEQLRVHKAFAERVKEKKELPMEREDVVTISHDRQFRTVNLNLSNVMTKNYVREVEKLQEKFAEDVRVGNITVETNDETIYEETLEKPREL